MSDIVIRAENLGKEYNIGRGLPFQTLRDAIKDTLLAPLRFLRSQNSRPKQTTMWALRDVSFEVKRGDILGVVGRNGAGKSTLLKILSRITEPTEGRVRMKGRVGSLLEVGTGFHAELTGRENIFLNGTIIGLSRAEIRRQFDDIVAFSELETFIDTPVKHYSSGMYMRLAFAVAAHLNTEILIVDEVLAVGDAAFQKRCLGKMNEVAKQGRTVLFVSHNIDAVRNLCKTALVLNLGKLDFAGAVEDGINHYYRLAQDLGQGRIGRPEHVLYEAPTDVQPGESSPECQVLSIEMLNAAGKPESFPRTWEPLTLRIHHRVKEPIPNLHPFVQFQTRFGTRLCILNTWGTFQQNTGVAAGDAYSDLNIPRLPLGAGDILIGAGLFIPHLKVFPWREDMGVMTVHGADLYQNGWPPAQPDQLVVFEHTWTRSP